MIVLMNKDNGLRTTDYGRLFNQHEFRHEFRRVFARAIASAGHPDKDNLWLYDDEDENEDLAAELRGKCLRHG